MARASVPTLLDLTTYGRIMGLDPLHLAGGYSALRPAGACNSIWMQYDWQDDEKVSREQLAECLRRAEEDLANFLGYWPAPVWLEDEFHEYPVDRRRELVGDGLTARGSHKPMGLNWGYVLYGGQRATEAIDPEEVTRNEDMDADGDTFAEWASFTITNVASDFDVCELRAYFKVFNVPDAANTRTDPASVGADPAWEVRPVTATLTGTTLTVLIPRWCLFRPQLQEAFNATGINADLVGSYVDTLLFYREHVDPEHQVQFLWGENCQSEACAQATQDGCFAILDRRNSIVNPQPGTYADGSFAYAGWTQGYEPDGVRFWYRAGIQPERYRNCEMDRKWQRLIAILATARLERPLCTCSSVEAKVQRLQDDFAVTTGDHSHQISFSIMDCPLGTRAGEIQVWQALKQPGHVRGRAILT